jgi:hypothetical protein
MDALLKKMNYKQGPITLLNAPPEFRPVAVRWQTQHEVTDAAGDGPLGFVIVFAASESDVRSIVAETARKVTKSTVFWVAFPKKTSKTYRSDINRDRLWELMEPMGFRPNRNVAVDEDWSALRLVAGLQGTA